MEDVYEFPMTVNEAILIHDALLELKNTFYVGGARKHFSVDKKEVLDNLIDTLGTWIDNRE